MVCEKRTIKDDENSRGISTARQKFIKGIRKSLPLGRHTWSDTLTLRGMRGFNFGLCEYAKLRPSSKKT